MVAEGSAEAPAPLETTADRDDAVLRAAVLAGLATTDGLRADAFDVAVEDGVVRLSTRGEVSATQWRAARDLASAIDGVGQVLMSDPEPDAGSGSAAPPVASARAPRFDVAEVVATPRTTPLPAFDAEGSGQPELAQSASGDRPRTYVVQAGDSLSIIAQRTMGDGLAWPRIYELNRSVIGPNPQALRAGMELRIPQE